VLLDQKKALTMIDFFRRWQQRFFDARGVVKDLIFVACQSIPALQECAAKRVLEVICTIWKQRYTSLRFDNGLRKQAETAGVTWIAADIDTRLLPSRLFPHIPLYD
jgi:hypothetical protein